MAGAASVSELPGPSWQSLARGRPRPGQSCPSTNVRHGTSLQKPYGSTCMETNLCHNFAPAPPAYPGLGAAMSVTRMEAVLVPVTPIALRMAIDRCRPRGSCVMTDGHRTAADVGCMSKDLSCVCPGVPWKKPTPGR